MRPADAIRLVDGARDLHQVRDVHLHRDGPPARAARSRRDRRSARSVPQAEHDVGARMRKRQSDRLTKAARGAGHEGHAARQVEAGESDVGCRHAAT